MRPYIDISNQKFGKLTVLKYMGKSRWLCQCECGNQIIAHSSNLKRNYTTSCGCLKGNHKHNLSNTRLYRIWENIKSRCYNKNYTYFCNYGGRGITVCNEWLIDFMNFYNWAINNGYKNGLTIDRIDVNGNYEPLNCRWIPLKEQANNTRRNVYVNYNNEKMTISEVARLLGKSYNTIHKIYRKGKN